MTGKTHFIAGITIGLVLGVSSPELALIGIGSMLPDIDHSSSTLGQKIKPLSSILEHRGPTHSLLFFLIGFLINPYLGLGILSHLFLDFLTPQGIKLFYPFKKNIKLPFFSKFIKTGGIIENLIFTVLLGIIFYICFLNIFPNGFNFAELFSQNLQILKDWLNLI